MTRLVFLYAPAAVCGLLALVISVYGRSDGIVIGGATALALALVGHTIQEVHETRRPDLEPAPRAATTWLPERWYRDLWLLAISIVVVVGVFNAIGQGDDIQAQRRTSILAACREQNARHDDTIAKLDSIIADLPPSQKAEAEQRREGTVLLIDALAPKRNCRALLRRSTTTPPD